MSNHHQSPVQPSHANFNPEADTGLSLPYKGSEGVELFTHEVKQLPAEEIKQLGEIAATGE